MTNDGMCGVAVGLSGADVGALSERLSVWIRVRFLDGRMDDSLFRWLDVLVRAR